MAKLNVEVLDMVNGKITKIAYEGAEYAKVDEKAEVGDIVVNNRGHEDLTIGGYYSVLKVYDTETVRVTDDVSDGHDIRKSLIYGPFRKMPVDKPTLEQRVGDLESDVAALKSSDSSLKGEKAAEYPKRLTVGDVSKVISRVPGFEGKVGDVVKIVKDDKSNFPYKCERISDGKDVGWFFESELEAYNEETIEFEGATYRKVDREAREGDAVIFRENTSGSVNNDTPYKVGHADYGGGTSGLGVRGYCRVYHDVFGRTRETVDVYEPIEQAKFVPQEGDIVVVESLDKRASQGSSVEVGDIGKIGNQGRICPQSSRIIVPGRSNVSNYVDLSEVRKATPAEVEAYEKAVHKASFAVGDYVKLIKSERGNVGAIAKIIEVGEISTQHVDGSITIEPFRLEHLTGEITACPAEWLVKATDAEITKAKAPKLKEGDFVKFKRGIHDTKADNPYLIEVDPSDGELAFRDDVNDWCSIAHSGEYEILSAEEAKWAKIGRKPKQLLKGDIVRITDACGAPLRDGDLIEVISDSHEDSAHVKGDLAVCSKLIATVESTHN